MRRLALILFALMVSGCPLQDEPAPAPSFPNATGVSKLVVSRGEIITDRAAIARFVGALLPLQSGWGYTWHTYPSAQATVTLVGLDGVSLCRVDIGPNWLGSDCGHSQPQRNWPPYVHLTSAQARLIRDTVGGIWEVK